MKHWVLGLGTIVLVSSGAALWIRAERARPIVSRQERDEADEHFRSEIATFRSRRCERGGSRPGSSEPWVRTLLSHESPLAACFAATADADVQLALDGTPERGSTADTPTWDFVVAHGVPASVRRNWMRIEAPLYPPTAVPAALQRVSAACASLAPSLERIASFREGCSPFPPGTMVRNGIVMRIEPLRGLSVATTVLARDQASAGDLEGALLLITQAALVFQDVRRGGADVLLTLVAQSEELLLWSTFQTLLMTETTLADDARARIEVELDRMLAHMPHPGAMLRAELTVVPFAGETDERLVDLASVAAMRLSREIQANCPSEASFEGCASRLEALIAPVADPPDFRAWLLGPHSVREELFEHARASELRDHVGYVRRAMDSPTAIAMAKLLLRIAARRSEGQCPNDPAEPPSVVAQSGSPITVAALAPGVLELSVAVPSDFPSMTALCPASPGGAWRPAGASGSIR